VKLDAPAYDYFKAYGYALNASSHPLTKQVLNQAAALLMMYQILDDKGRDIMEQELKFVSMYLKELRPAREVNPSTRFQFNVTLVDLGCEYHPGTEITQ
jgi:hypothetical protein